MDITKFMVNGKLSEKLLFEAKTDKCSMCPIAFAIKYAKKEEKVILGNIIALNSRNVIDEDCVMDEPDIQEFEA